MLRGRIVYRVKDGFKKLILLMTKNENVADLNLTDLQKNPLLTEPFVQLMREITDSYIKLNNKTK